MSKKYVTVELGGNPRIWANLRNRSCAIMSRSPRQGVFVLGNSLTEYVTERLDQLVSGVGAGVDLPRDPAEPDLVHVLGLENPMRTLHWYPEATSEKYVVLDWSAGADGTDGFLQLVEKMLVEQWPEMLREGLNQIEQAATELG
jgi:hypothetical protein